MKPLAIIGGSGLESPDFIKNNRKAIINTPYGDVDYIEGTIDNKAIILLSRHGKKHTITPSQINNKANIWALKALDCDKIIATTACGSLRQEIGRGDLVIIDQFIDFTKHRESTFFDTFEPGDMKHTPMGDPFDTSLRKLLQKACDTCHVSYHKTGTVITIEGPRFSTRAESLMFRTWGADIINMTTAPEATLANEIGIPYAAIAMATDYDCWKTDEPDVTWQAVLEIFRSNIKNIIQVLETTVNITN